MVLREWAQKGTKNEIERPDSFLDRFRGPDVKTLAAAVGDSSRENIKEGGVKIK